jgi:transposase
VRKDIAPLVNELIEWMKQQRTKLSPHNDVVKAMNYMLNRIESFTCFLEDGRICISNNAAERALRGIALGRKAWLFAGSDRGGERAAIMFTLIQTAKINDVDPQAWLADVLARIADHKINDLAALLPWNWRVARMDRAA